MFNSVIVPGGDMIKNFPIYDFKPTFADGKYSSDLEYIGVMTDRYMLHVSRDIHALAAAGHTTITDFNSLEMARFTSTFGDVIAKYVAWEHLNNGLPH